eukprot:CAMPEP_0117067622 /NCGR_PEP_ID=MMETSP0472-20121206/47340_1 /TAXON_ID=693140 ORGANISM="Tiarina fusus, Strain LIS" /NCGR_SAMPLE_ID=MMETSP0472 /ASSEMBLY_ACC=CAM_ASM_000603 /LENGTH=846 /DNA_ID=CAMNT_0004789251 /DNA_START=95 /DNA_END=2636 /DNA_ORIENTATION=+
MPPKSDQELIEAISNLRRVPKPQRRERHSASSSSTATTSTSFTNSASCSLVAPAIPPTIVDSTGTRSSGSDTSTTNNNNEEEKSATESASKSQEEQNNKDATGELRQHAPRMSSSPSPAAATSFPSATLESPIPLAEPESLVPARATESPSIMPDPVVQAVDDSPFPLLLNPLAAAAAALLDEVEEEDEHAAMMEAFTPEDREARCLVFKGAARVGELVRLREHVVESVAVETKEGEYGHRDDDDTWQLKSGLETQVVRSSMFRIVTEAAALGSIKQRCKPEHEVCNWDVQVELNRRANPAPRKDRRRAMIRRASMLVDGFVNERRQTKPAAWDAEAALKELEAQEASLKTFSQGQTSMVLPTPDIPTFTPKVVFVTKGKLRDVVSAQAAEEGTIRSERLRKFKVLQVTTEGCKCIYCKHPSIFQTQTYQRLSKHKAWTDESLEGEDDIWRGVPDELRPVGARRQDRRRKTVANDGSGGDDVASTMYNPRLTATLVGQKKKKKALSTTSAVAATLPLWAIPGNTVLGKKELSVKTSRTPKQRASLSNRSGGSTTTTASGQRQKRGTLTRSKRSTTSADDDDDDHIVLKTRALQGIGAATTATKKNTKKASLLSKKPDLPPSQPEWASPGQYLRRKSEKRRLSAKSCNVMSPHSPSNQQQQQQQQKSSSLYNDETPPSTPAWASAKFRNDNNNKVTVPMSAPGKSHGVVAVKRSQSTITPPTSSSSVPVWASPGFRRRGLPFGSPKLDEDVDEEELFRKELAKLKREAGIGVYDSKNNTKKNRTKNRLKQSQSQSPLSPSKLALQSPRPSKNKESSPNSSKSPKMKTPPRRRQTIGSLPSHLPLLSP